MNRDKLINQLKALDEEIKSYGTSTEERRKERRELLHKYNDTKDAALRSLSILSEQKGTSLDRLMKEKGINFDTQS
jgi:hypothetical protein